MSVNSLSILIPSYERLNLTLKSIELALQSPANEIIVSDDSSNGDLIPLFSISNDPRLRIIVQERRLGLWENHLFLLQIAKSEWVYFLQTDDSFCLQFFDILGGHIANEVGIIHSDPQYLNIDSGLPMPSAPGLVTPRQYSSMEMSRLLLKRGNLLGRPSYNIYRRKYLPMNQDYWRSEIAADLVVNTILSTNYSVIVLEPYLTTCGIHSKQDGNTQSIQLAYDRILNASLALKAHSTSTARFANVFFGVEFLFFVSYWIKVKLISLAKGKSNDFNLKIRKGSPLFLKANPFRTLDYFVNKTKLIR